MDSLEWHNEHFQRGSLQSNYMNSPLVQNTQFAIYLPPLETEKHNSIPLKLEKNMKWIWQMIEKDGYCYC